MSSLPSFKCLFLCVSWSGYSRTYCTCASLYFRLQYRFLDLSLSRPSFLSIDRGCARRSEVSSFLFLSPARLGTRNRDTYPTCYLRTRMSSLQLLLYATLSGISSPVEAVDLVISSSLQLYLYPPRGCCFFELGNCGCRRNR